MRLEYFELIDTVEELDPEAGTIRVVSELPQRSPVFDGHFPKFPVLPGVMMLEIMNHAAGYMLYRRHEKKKFVFLGGVKRAKFRRFVEPGAVMTVNARIAHDGSGYCVAESDVWVNGEVASDAEIVMITADFPNAAIEQELFRRSHNMRVLAPVGA